MGVRRPQVDHPLPRGEGRGEGTAFHVESCRGRGNNSLVTSASGSVEGSPSPPSPSPGGRGVIGFANLCPRITNGHLDARLGRLAPVRGNASRFRQKMDGVAGGLVVGDRHYVGDRALGAKGHLWRPGDASSVRDQLKGDGADAAAETAHGVDRTESVKQ